jgi:proteic killer suppression protein
VIKSFRSADTQALFETGKCKRFSGIANIAIRKLAQLDAAHTLDFLRSPPGNHLEALKGKRKGQHSIRVNDQFRVCFAGRKKARRTWRLWTITEDNGDV